MNLEKIMTDITLFLVMSIIMEYVVGILTEKLPPTVTKYINANIISLAIGVLLAVTFKLDIFASLGLQTSWVVIAWLVTGILLAGGSKLWHELIAKLRASRDDIYTEQTIEFSSANTDLIVDKKIT